MQYADEACSIQMKHAGDDLAVQHDPPSDICHQDGTPNQDWYLMAILIVASLWRMAQTLMTFGTGIPAGLFVPTLFIGACMGRFIGNLVYLSNEQWHWSQYRIEPGAYAMIGAAAVLVGGRRCMA